MTERTDTALSPSSPNNTKAAPISSARRSMRRSVSGTPAHLVGLDMRQA